LAACWAPAALGVVENGRVHGREDSTGWER
jgi:hypothetical protein